MKKQMTKSKFTFPIGYHEFHKDQAFNFQLNRYYSMGYARFEHMEEAGQKINSFEEWKIEMLEATEVRRSTEMKEQRYVDTTGKKHPGGTVLA